eukprot:TRINITY_DN762_c0_g1_i1.p1 TRINITY_DN762_c0_g1~~TRINITY_DN762_c0_g1_i1.p1  ORF type:complete len:311 (+),score=44.29 TRINITY_DN762_c0_g1_i1:89-1021(+)
MARGGDRGGATEGVEFPFEIGSGASERGHDGGSGPRICYIDERRLRGSEGGLLGTVLEEMGQRSAVAQGLRRPVTFGSPTGLGDQRVYLLVDGRTALGFLKVGRKRLFVAAPPPTDVGFRGAQRFADVQDALREIEPLCALDFYVHERCQRRGHGRRLFDAMLAREKVEPAMLGYDRPSPKLLGFLSSHYGLNKYRPQNNNFVVFDRYFDPHCEEATQPLAPQSSRRHAGLQTGREVSSPSHRDAPALKHSIQESAGRRRLAAGHAAHAEAGGYCGGRRDAPTYRTLFDDRPSSRGDFRQPISAGNGRPF